MNSPKSDQPGRPLTFDPDKVLFEILNVFWQRGYDFTSVGDLEDATGLTRPSLYNTFGNKRAMYEKAIARYLAMMENFFSGSLVNGSAGLDDLIGFVDQLVDAFHDDSHAAGCAILNAMAAHGELDPYAAEVARKYRQMLFDGLKAAAGRAAQAGEIDEADVDLIADRMHTYLVGLNILTRHSDTYGRINANADAIKSDIKSWSLLNQN